MAYIDSVFRSAEMDDPERHLSDSYGRVEFDVDRCEVTHHIGGDERFLLATADFSGNFDCHVAFDDLVITTAAAPSPWNEGRDSGDLLSAPALFRPGMPIQFTSDSGTRSVVFDRAALERTARLLYARDNLVVAFDSPQPVSTQASRAWFAALDLVRGYHAADQLGNDLLRSSVYRLLAVTALEGFRLRADRRNLHAGAQERRRVYRVASDFFHDFASLPITVDDAAEAAGTSSAEVILAFRSHTTDEVTPEMYLRRVRLDAARQDLLAGDTRRGDTVAAIAARWGFGSPRRFAADFHTAFGASPQWVLDD